MSGVAPNQPEGLSENNNSDDELFLGVQIGDISGNANSPEMKRNGSAATDREPVIEGFEELDQYKERDMSTYALRPNRRKRKTQVAVPNKRQKGTNPMKDLTNLWDEVARIQDKDARKMMEWIIEELITLLESCGGVLKDKVVAMVAVVKDKLKDWPIYGDVDVVFTCIQSLRKLIGKAKKDGSFDAQKENVQRKVLILDEFVDKMKEKRAEVVKMKEKKAEDEHLIDRFMTELDDPNPETMLQIYEKFESTEETSNDNLTVQGVDIQSVTNSKTGYEVMDVVVAQTKHISPEYVEDFLKNLFSEENNNVKLSDFSLINEFSIDYIDGQLKKLCGEKYQKDSRLTNEKTLVWAAIMEMESIQLGTVDEIILLRWGAAFKKAEQAGYHIKFAKDHLELITRAYFVGLGGMREEFNRIQKCMKATSDFQKMRTYGQGIISSDA